jgi:hypothetical protein
MGRIFHANRSIVHFCLKVGLKYYRPFFENRGMYKTALQNPILQKPGIARHAARQKCILGLICERTSNPQHFMVYRSAVDFL